jgi:glyoxylase-like metal-dependent hydrolase (beta-lactamase superfamily II)
VRIGSIEVFAVLDGIAQVSKHHSGFAKVGEEQWRRHAQFLHGEFFRLDIGGLLVQTDERLVLVDLGISRFGPPPYNVGGRFLKSLAVHGHSPTDITDVVFTHLHIDHIGWASDEKGNPTFPNATYRCHIADWMHFVEDKPDDPDNATLRLLRPLASHLEPWTKDMTLFAGVDVLCAPGHTPGNSAIVLSSGTQRGLLLGDIVHCPVQLLDEEWAMFGDMDPVLARKTRNTLAAELERTQDRATSCHFPEMAFGRIIRSEAGRKWVLA